MVIYNRYINQEDHVWYDSSNLVYSKCYDSPGSMEKTLKIVFKGGRTYVYKGVDVKDYLSLKTSQSNGEAFSKYIKKYPAVRISDTDLEKIYELREQFGYEAKENNEQKFGDVEYHIIYNEETKEFSISLGDRPLFKGVDEKFPVLNLFSSLGLNHTITLTDEPLQNDSDENTDELSFSNYLKNKITQH